MQALKKGDVVSASTVIRATPAEVYDVVSNVSRIPEWSPECVRAVWIDETTFRGTNRRRFGRWTTQARVVAAEPAHEFAFAVQLGGGDFTRWSYQMEQHADGCRLTEEVRMCVDVPFHALMFERIALQVRDRRTDLQGNIDRSLRRLSAIIEAESTLPNQGAPVGTGAR